MSDAEAAVVARVLGWARAAMGTDMAATPADRHAASGYLEALKSDTSTPDLIRMAELLFAAAAASPATDDAAGVMLAFHLLSRVVLAPDRWSALPPPTRDRVRSLALAAASGSAAAAPSAAAAHLRASQAAALLAGVAVRTWPSAWPSFLPDLTSGGLPPAIVCDALAALSDDVHGSEYAAGGALTSARRAELAAALADALPTILPYVTAAAEAFYASGDARGMRAALSALRAYMRWAPATALLAARAPAACVALLADGELREAALGCLDALGGRKEPPPSPFAEDALLLPLATAAGGGAKLGSSGGGGGGLLVPAPGGGPGGVAAHRFRVRFAAVAADLVAAHGDTTVSSRGLDQGGVPVVGSALREWVGLIAAAATAPSVELRLAVLPFWRFLFTAAAKAAASATTLSGGGGVVATATSTAAAAVAASRANLALTFLPTAVAAFLPAPYADPDWFAVDDVLRHEAGDDSDDEDGDDDGDSGGEGAGGSNSVVATKLDRHGFRTALTHLRSRSSGVLTAAAALAPDAAAGWVLTRLNELLAAVPTVSFAIRDRPERLADAVGPAAPTLVPVDAAPLAANLGVPPSVAASWRLWRFDVGSGVPSGGGSGEAGGEALLGALDGLLPAVDSVLAALRPELWTPPVVEAAQSTFARLAALGDGDGGAAAAKGPAHPRLLARKALGLRAFVPLYRLPTDGGRAALAAAVRALVAQTTLPTPVAGTPGGDGGGGNAPALAAVREARNRACHALATICRRMTTHQAAAVNRAAAAAAPSPPAPNNLLPLVAPLCDHVASLLATPAGDALYPGDKCVLLEAAVLTTRLLVPRAIPTPPSVGDTVAGTPPVPPPPPLTAERDRVLGGLLTPAVAGVAAAAAALPSPAALLGLSASDRDGLAAALLVADGGVHAAAAAVPPPTLGGAAATALGAAAAFLAATLSLPAVDASVALPTAREVMFLLNADSGRPASGMAATANLQGTARATAIATDALARLGVSAEGLALPGRDTREWVKAVRHSAVELTRGGTLLSPGLSPAAVSAVASAAATGASSAEPLVLYYVTHRALQALLSATVLSRAAVAAGGGHAGAAAVVAALAASPLPALLSRVAAEVPDRGDVATDAPPPTVAVAGGVAPTVEAAAAAAVAQVGVPTDAAGGGRGEAAAVAAVADLLRLTREHARPVLARAAAEMLAAAVPPATDEPSGSGSGGSGSGGSDGDNVSADGTPYLDLYGGDGALTAAVWAVLLACVRGADAAACRVALGVISRLADDVASRPADGGVPPPDARIESVASRLISGALRPVLLTAVALDGGGPETAFDAAVGALLAILRTRPPVVATTLGALTATEPPAVAAALRTAAAEAATDAARAVASTSGRRAARGAVRSAVAAVAAAKGFGVRPRRAAVPPLTSAAAGRVAGHPSLSALFASTAAATARLAALRAVATAIADEAVAMEEAAAAAAAGRTAVQAVTTGGDGGGAGDGGVGDGGVGDGGVGGVGGERGVWIEAEGEPRGSGGGGEPTGGDTHRRAAVVAAGAANAAAADAAASAAVATAAAGRADAAVADARAAAAAAAVATRAATAAAAAAANASAAADAAAAAVAAAATAIATGSDGGNGSGSDTGSDSRRLSGSKFPPLSAAATAPAAFPSSPPRRVTPTSGGAHRLVSSPRRQQWQLSPLPSPPPPSPPVVAPVVTPHVVVASLPQLSPQSPLAGTYPAAAPIIRLPTRGDGMATAAGGAGSTPFPPSSAPRGGAAYTSSSSSSSSARTSSGGNDSRGGARGGRGGGGRNLAPSPADARRAVAAAAATGRRLSRQLEAGLSRPLAVVAGAIPPASPRFG
ncbi:hypothetical protein MMPV_005840 [Pyropia vietnamensis]